MGKNTRRKRESTPTFYVIPRKEKTFATNISPGPHPKPLSYDPVTLLRDVLKLVYNRREALRVIKDGKLIVDGRVRRDHRFPIGLMDVVELSGTELVYRILPYKGKQLYPVEIPPKEKNVKLCVIKTKKMVKGGKTQLGTHDGRTFLVDDGSKYQIGDSLLIETPSQRILDLIKLAPNSLVLVIRGARTGSLGEVVEVKKGSIMVKPSVKVSFKGEEVILPKEVVMPVGMKAPAITLPVEG
jgi:small subunit ribosomal protein S4e